MTYSWLLHLGLKLHFKSPKILFFDLNMKIFLSFLYVLCMCTSFEIQLKVSVWVEYICLWYKMQLCHCSSSVPYVSSNSYILKPSSPTHFLFISSILEAFFIIYSTYFWNSSYARSVEVTMWHLLHLLTTHYTLHVLEQLTCTLFYIFHQCLCHLQKYSC